MCRLLFSFNSSQHSDIEKDNFARALLTMKAGGPDSTGIKNIYPHLLMGLNRLSLKDRRNIADQPYSSLSGNSTIIYNGEIYNHDELRSYLPEHKWKTSSDTETIVELIELYSPEFILPKIRGMYAFVYYDKRKNKILISRDNSGIKPLFITSLKKNNNHILCISSEIKAILDFLNKRNFSISDIARDEYFNFGYVRQPKTIFNEIKAVPTNCYLEFDISKGFMARHNLNQENFNLAGDLEEILSESLELRLQKDLEIPYFLSGGIDSTLLVAIAKRKLGLDPITISATFNKTDYDESKFIANTINKLNIKNTHTINIIPNNFIYETIDNIAELTDQPFADSSFIVTKYLCNVAKNLNFKGYIGADGADECFWGYLKYKNFCKYLKLRKLFYLPFFREINKKINYEANHPMDELDVIISSNEHPFNRNKKSYSSISKKINPSSLLEYDRSTYLQSDILVKCDLAGMSESIENREVYLDQNIIKWSNKYYENYSFNSAPESKLPLKKLLFKYFPDYQTPKKKMGFATPLPNWSIYDSTINNIVSKELNEKSLLQIFEKVPSYISSYQNLNLDQRKKYHSKIWLYFCWSKFVKSF